jgi:hypothetical protein
MDPQQFATAYALSSSVGLRAFMTLALASLAMHFGYLHPSHSFAWLGTNDSTEVLIGLAVIEFLIEKVPVVDHAAHALHFTTKPIAAALLVGSVAPEPNGSIDAGTYVLMIAAALNALGIHGISATTRVASTATTAGIANPFVSVGEDALAIAGTIGAIVLPFLAAAGALLLTAIAVCLAVKIRGRRRRSVAGV